MDKILIAKKIISTTIGIGISKIVTGIIESNVDTTTTASKVTVKAAGFAIGAAASDASAEYTDKKVDEIVDWYKKIRTQNVKK